MSQPPRILIDGNSMVLRTGSTHLSGIGRATSELLCALDYLHDPNVQISVFTQTFRGRFCGDTARIMRTNIPVPIGPRFDWIKSRLPLLETLIGFDALHIPHNYAPVYKPSSTLVTIHDAIFFAHPEDSMGHRFARQHYPLLAKQSIGVATCSQSSKSDIAHYMGVKPENIRVIPLGVNRDIFSALPKVGARSALELQFGLSRPYHLSVSCSGGRKNTIAVMRAFKRALATGVRHDLVLLWEAPPRALLEEFRFEIETGRLRLLPHVDDATLRVLYSGATFTWFVSRYEGFGLPILESMSCGTPVVTCSNSSLREVGGDAAIYVRPDAYDDMADIMQLADEDVLSYSMLFQKSLEQAGRYSWTQTAIAYLGFYKDMCAR